MRCIYHHFFHRALVGSVNVARHKSDMRISIATVPLGEVIFRVSVGIVGDNTHVEDNLLDRKCIRFVSKKRSMAINCSGFPKTTTTPPPFLRAGWGLLRMG